MKKINNIHLYISKFTHDTRILKQTISLLKHNIISKCYVSALHETNLSEYEMYYKDAYVKRFKIRSMFLFKGLWLIEFYLRNIFFYKEKKIDIINIHHVMLLPLGYLMKKIFNAKLVYDTHELECETINSNFIYKKTALIVERILIKKCDLVFVVSENISDWYKKKYHIEKPPVIYNSPNAITIKRKNLFRKIFNISPDIKIALYQGALLNSRGIKILLECFRENNRSDICLVIMGSGPLESTVKEFAKKYSNIKFHPAVSPMKLIEYTSSADIGISLIENHCLSYNYCMPNKFFEYAMAGLPVIVSNVKEMSETVLKNRMGIVAKTAQTKELNDTINSLLDKNLLSLSKNSRKFAINNSWEIQEKKMLKSYRKIL